MGEILVGITSNLCGVKAELPTGIVKQIFDDFRFSSGTLWLK